MSDELHWVRILYRSGAVVDLRVGSFEVIKGCDGLVHAVRWDETACSPSVLHWGISEIAAVFDYGNERPPQ